MSLKKVIVPTLSHMGVFLIGVVGTYLIMPKASDCIIFDRSLESLSPEENQAVLRLELNQKEFDYKEKKLWQYIRALEDQVTVLKQQNKDNVGTTN